MKSGFFQNGKFVVTIICLPTREYTITYLGQIFSRLSKSFLSFCFVQISLDFTYFKQKIGFCSSTLASLKCLIKRNYTPYQRRLVIIIDFDMIVNYRIISPNSLYKNFLFLTHISLVVLLQQKITLAICMHLRSTNIARVYDIIFFYLSREVYKNVSFHFFFLTRKM